MSDLQEYKCPACGGAVSFDSGTQQMKCPYCDTSFEIEALKGYNDEISDDQPSKMEWDTSANAEWQDGELENISVYSCNSCGGEIVGDNSMAATKCPYCDNPVVMKGQFAGDLRPNYIIPFKLDKKMAKEALKKHLTGKKLLPKVFSDQNHIDEIKGIYVPFWLFDTDVEANIRYKAAKTRTWSDSQYNYSEKSFYNIIREGTISFDHVPVDGSTKMEGDLMESIEPYNFNEVVDFQTAYLAGYLADKYDVDADQSIDRANERVKNSTESAFASTVKGYNEVTAEHSNIQLLNGKVQYALLPVWILNTTWNGNKYTFAMNGQTGKFVGNLPVDMSAYWRWFMLITVITSVVVFCAQLLFAC